MKQKRISLIENLLSDKDKFHHNFSNEDSFFTHSKIYNRTEDTSQKVQSRTPSHCQNDSFINLKNKLKLPRINNVTFIEKQQQEQFEQPINSLLQAGSESIRVPSKFHQLGESMQVFIGSEQLFKKNNLKRKVIAKTMINSPQNQSSKKLIKQEPSQSKNLQDNSNYSLVICSDKHVRQKSQLNKNKYKINFTQLTPIIKEKQSERKSQMMKNSPNPSYRTSLSRRYEQDISTKFSINNPEIQAHIIKIFCEGKQYQEINLIQVSRKQLKSYLDQRYPKQITKKILSYFEIKNNFSLSELIDKFNTLLCAQYLDQMEFNMYLFDEGNDGLICMKDVNEIIGIIDSHDHFVQQDLYNIIQEINVARDIEAINQSPNTKRSIYKASNTNLTMNKYRIPTISFVTKDTNQNSSSPYLKKFNKQSIMTYQDLNSPLIPLKTLKSKFTQKQTLKKKQFQSINMNNSNRLIKLHKFDQNYLNPSSLEEKKTQSNDKVSFTKVLNSQINKEITQKSLYSKAEKDGFFQFINEKQNELQDKITSFSFSKSQQTSPLNMKLQSVKQMFFEYMKKSYFNNNEFINLDKFANYIQFDYDLPNIMIDLYIYLFNYSLTFDFLLKKQMQIVQNRIVQTQLIRKKDKLRKKLDSEILIELLQN